MSRGGASRRGDRTTAEYDREVRRTGRADVPSLTTRARNRCRHCGIGLWKKGPPVCNRDVCTAKESRLPSPPMSDAPAIFEVMAAVKRAVGFIGKNDRNTHFNFNFRGIDAVMNAFHQPMVDHGLVLLPHVEHVEYTVVGDSVRCHLKLRLTFYAPDGSSLEAVGAGEAIDKQDKATPQAMQQAFKYTLLQAFSVPTQDMEDSDAKGPVEDTDWHGSLRELLSKVPWPDDFDDETEDLYQSAGIARFTKGNVNTVSGLSVEQAQYIAGKLKTSKQRTKFVTYATEAVEGSGGGGGQPTEVGSGEASPSSDTPPEPSDGDRLWKQVQELWRNLEVQGPRVLVHARQIVDQDGLEPDQGRVAWDNPRQLGADAHPTVLQGLLSWLEDLRDKAGAA